MNLGQFSISLAVKSLAESRSFYENLGFEAMKYEKPYPGYEQNWVIMQNAGATIGLFQGMFEKNIITFNPSDVRSIQTALKAKGIAIQREADETTTGPAHMVLVDPDGNGILLDQHNP
ncbi:MAG: VOC family protein [Bryobacteraceae bacterium]